MKQLPAVFATDAINRYWTRFSVGTLASILLDNAEIGNPSPLSHDSTRPIGWTLPLAIHFEPGLTRLTGCMLVPETREDREQLRILQQEHLNRLAQERSVEIAELKALLAPHLQGEERLLFKDGVALVGPGLATRVFPQAFALPDKDGLFDLNQLAPIGPGAYRFGDLVLFAHPFLRRSLSRVVSLICLDAPGRLTTVA